MKSAKLFLIVLAVAASGSVGCGAVHLRASFQSLGEMNLERDAAIRKAFDESRGKKIDGLEKISVLVDTVPAGIKWDGRVISVEPGFQHVIVGKFAVTPSFRFFPDFVDDWRKGLCWWQQPLVVATLFIWMAVPTYYACFSTIVRDKREIVTEVKRVTAVAGGDMAMIQFIWGHEEVARGASGWILRRDPKVPKDNTKPMPKPPVPTRI